LQHTLVFYALGQRTFAGSAWRCWSQRSRLDSLFDQSCIPVRPILVLIHWTNSTLSSTKTWAALAVMQNGRETLQPARQHRI